ncbi:MAG: ribosomal protein S18-alanine N-acetyltransferase [Hydrogenophilales bacterium]
MLGVKKLKINNKEELFLLESDLFTNSWSENALEEQLEIKASLNLGLKANNELISYVLCQDLFPEIEILRFGVKRKFQLQGNGKFLLKSLISLLKQKNYNRIFLEVNTSNSRAISLYKQFGFIDISIRKNYYFETGIYYDAKIMQLTL